MVVPLSFMRVGPTYAVNLGDISVISRRYLGYRPVTKISVSDIGHISVNDNIGGQRRNIGRYLAKPYRLSRRYLGLAIFSGFQQKNVEAGFQQKNEVKYCLTRYPGFRSCIRVRRMRGHAQVQPNFQLRNPFFAPPPPARAGRTCGKTCHKAIME
ncbi:hypothetical protein HanIR_Chr04g0187761 [Helianthus annuus]|nr:hypothetical protein HanIR_Chr04g0187761 [Helianthus annuus]